MYTYIIRHDKNIKCKKCVKSQYYKAPSVRSWYHGFMALQQCKFLVFGPLLSGLAAALPPPEHEGEDSVQEVEAASSEPQHVDRGEGGVRREACSSDVVHYSTVQYSTVQYSTVQLVPITVW